MPLTNPKNAIEHLYPSIGSRQYRFRDDGQGVYLEWLDPALGEPPTQEQLEAAEVAYIAPSRLSGGNREPGLADIERNLSAAYDYFRAKVVEKVRAAYAAAGFEDVSINDRGQFVKTGVPEKAAKYAQVTSSPFRNISRLLIQWESDVWTYLQTRWKAIDPRRDFTGFDGVTPPTWPQLENDIDSNFPTPGA